MCWRAPSELSEHGAGSAARPIHGVRKWRTDTIIPFVDRTNIIILANHGTVSYGETVEQAYWWTEILDAYCRMLLLAKQLGRVNYFTQDEAQGLLDLKQKWGFDDPRNTKEYENCDICANDIFRDSWASSGVEPRAFQAPKNKPDGLALSQAYSVLAQLTQLKAH